MADSPATAVKVQGERLASLEIYNPGPNLVYFGDANVASATGMILLPNDYRLFKGVQIAFVVYFICSSGQSQSLNVVEYP